MKNLLKVVYVAGGSEDEIRNALQLQWSNFEDSVQYSVALLNNMDAITTRNPKDYQESQLEVLLPEELLDKMK